MNRFYGGAPSFTGTQFNPYVKPTTVTYPSQPTSFTYPQNYSSTAWNLQPTQQNYQTVIPNQTNIIWIDSPDQISTYATGKGWQQWFAEKNDQILYVRDTDMNGVIQPVVKLRYEVVDQPQVVSNSSEQNVSAPSIDTSNFVSKDEFNKLSDSVNTLVEKLADLLK